VKQALRSFLLFVLLALAAQPSAFACATCYGASDSPLAQGMNWGIITLLVVVGSVMFGITAFFVHIGIKSARLGQAAAPNQNSTESNP
jgi:hypothetical protein